MEEILKEVKMQALLLKVHYSFPFLLKVEVVRYTIPNSMHAPGPLRNVNAMHLRSLPLPMFQHPSTGELSLTFSASIR